MKGSPAYQATTSKAKIARDEFVSLLKNSNTPLDDIQKKYNEFASLHYDQLKSLITDILPKQKNIERLLKKEESKMFLFKKKAI